MPFLQDLRHGVRTLRRVPGLVAVAVITLALGIGANTAIFSVIYSVLLKPLVFPEPDRLMQVWMAFPERGIDQTSWSHGHFWDAREMVQAFEELGAVEFGDVNLTGLGDPEKLDAVRVNAGFFRVLGVSPVAGRVLRDGEDQPGQDPNVAILSHRFWTRRFGQDPAVVGRTVMLNGVSHEVIGVLPAGTPFLDWTDIFRPLVRTPNAQRGSWELFGIGRLKRGVTLEAARSDLQRVMKVLAERHPETSRGMSGSLLPVSRRPPSRPKLRRTDRGGAHVARRRALRRSHRRVPRGPVGRRLSLARGAGGGRAHPGRARPLRPHRARHRLRRRRHHGVARPRLRRGEGHRDRRRGARLRQGQGARRGGRPRRPGRDPRGPAGAAAAARRVRRPRLQQGLDRPHPRQGAHSRARPSASFGRAAGSRPRTG